MPMVRASTRASGGMSRPTRRAIAATVVGLSPEMTLIVDALRRRSTPACPAASGRTCSVSDDQRDRTHPAGQHLPASAASRVPEQQHPAAGPRPSPSTRSRIGSSGGRAARPARRRPRTRGSANDAALHLRAELKAMVCVRSQPVGAASAAASALSVPFALGSSAIAPRAVSHLVGGQRLPAHRFAALVDDVTDRQRAGLVQADDVHPGQALDGRQFLDEHLLAGQRAPRPGGRPPTSAAPAPRGPGRPGRRSTG